MLIASRLRGFSLIELLVAVSVLAILTAVAMPSFSNWIRNAKIRTVADAVQSGLRVAQSEAQRRTRTVVFFRTSSKDCALAATAAANGQFWQVRVVPDPLQTGDVAEPVQCGTLTDVSTGVKLSASATALCFGADGRQTTMANPASIGVDCTAAAASYDIESEIKVADARALRVTVSLAGAPRLCDPAKASTAPDGCRS